MSNTSELPTLSLGRIQTSDNFNMDSSSNPQSDFLAKISVGPRRPKKIDNEYTSREVLLAEKNDLINQIQYLEDQIKEKQKSLNLSLQEKAKKIDDAIAFQQRFSKQEVSETSKRRYAAEAKIAKLSEVIEGLEKRYNELTVMFAPEKEMSIKTDIVFQRRQISLLKHDVDEIKRKHDEIETKLESDEFKQRMDDMDELRKQFIELKNEYRAEKKKNSNLTSELKTIEKKYPTPEKEMKLEIEKLKHQLDTMSKVNDMINRKVHYTNKYHQPAAPKENPSKNPRNKALKPAEEIDEGNVNVFETEAIHAEPDEHGTNTKTDSNFDSSDNEENGEHDDKFDSEHNESFDSDRKEDTPKEEKENDFNSEGNDAKSDGKQTEENKNDDSDFESDKQNNDFGSDFDE